MDDGWRLGCVTRARPVSAGMRFIEFALSGPPPVLEAGATVDILTGPRGAIQTFACLPAEPGSLRILVPRGDGAAARFMWALVEGAHVRGRLSDGDGSRQASRRTPALRGLPTVRLAVGGSPGGAATRAAAPPAAADEPDSGRVFPFPRVARAAKGRRRPPAKPVWREEKF